MVQISLLWEHRRTEGGGGVIGVFNTPLWRKKEVEVPGV